MKIGIAGIGGIGSNVARLLAQARVKQIKLVDFDHVDATNLNRQFYRISQVGEKKVHSLEQNLREIYPEMIIETLDRKLTSKDASCVFHDCAMVVEGLDHPAAKKMLVEDLARSNIQVIAASGISGPDLSNIRTFQMGHCQIVGDFSSDAADDAVFPPKIAMVSAIMAALVLNTIKEITHDNIPNTGCKYQPVR